MLQHQNFHIPRTCSVGQEACKAWQQLPLVPLCWAVGSGLPFCDCCELLLVPHWQSGLEGLPKRGNAADSVQQAPSVSMCLQQPVAGDAASPWATWDLSPCSPDILRESFSSGEGMKLKANQLPREGGRLAAEQRRAVCCQTLSKISQTKVQLHSHGMWASAPCWLLEGGVTLVLLRPALTTPLEQCGSH